MIPTYNTDGTPSEETLYIIEAWEGQYSELSLFVQEVWHPEQGSAIYDRGKLTLDTGGNQHNEMIVEWLKANETFWQLCNGAQYGNRYTFEVR